MSGASVKRCVVAYACQRQQYLWALKLAPGACIADALAAAHAVAAHRGEAAGIPWETAAVGIFGELRGRGETFADGDRIELYRPLEADPRERRREQVARARRAQRSPR